MRMTRTLDSHWVPLRVENLVKKIGDFTLRAQFTIGVGERTALIGTSGIGKTSLLRTIAGLEPLRREDRGHIFLGEKELTFLSPQARQIGFVFQDSALFSGMNVLENIIFGLRVRGVGRKEREEQGQQWLQRIGLNSRGRASVESLLGGEKQRVAFARALIWKPQLLLLDEPFSSLDAKLKQDLAGHLVELHRHWPVPMILVSHDEMDLQWIATSRLYLSATVGAVRQVSRELTSDSVFD